MKNRTFGKSLSRTIIYCILALILIMGIGASSIGYITFTDVIQTQYKENANMIAKTVAENVDSETLDYYLQTKQKDEAYLQTERIFQTIADNDDCAVIYVAKVDTVNNQREYIYNVVSRDSGFYPYEIGFRDDIEENFKTGYSAVLRGERTDENFVYGDSKVIGAYVTTIVPIRDKGGKLIAICGVVKTMKSLELGRSKFLKQILIWAIAIAIIVGSIGIVLLRKRIVFPLRKIVTETERFADTGELLDENRISTDIVMKNEIGELAYAVDQMEEVILDNVGKLVSMTAEKNRIGAELDIAQKLQKNVLPKISETFPGRDEIDVFATMNPAKEVGGDFYDCFFIDKTHFAMVIADVAGKGVPAALFMMITKVLLKTVALENDDPAKILSIVNKKICDNNESGMFVTVWLGILDLETGEVKAANAGHEYPVICDESGEYSLIKDKHGFVLGGLETSEYETYSINMKPGDRLFVYTDGLPEANDVTGEQYGIERMLKSLNENSDKAPKDLGTAVLEELAAYTADVESFDDTTFLFLRYNGRSDDMSNNVKAEISNGVKELVLDATVDNIAVVTDFVNDALESINCPNDVKVQFDIVIDELFGNIAQYAYHPENGEAIVRIDLSKSDEIILQFTDHGKPFNPLDNEDPDLSLAAEERSIGGLGVYIAKAYMDELDYRYEDNKNILTAKKHL